MKAAIKLEGLVKRFADPRQPTGYVTAVDDVSLEVDDGEFLTMVGPSGCGKSTILRLIAGLERPTAGEIYIEGKRVSAIPPKDRGIGFMFQGYALFGHMTVMENIEFGLRLRKMPARQRRERVRVLLSLVGLEGLESRKPSQLSGGQQQRVALARALAPQPRLLLLDEPFGAVDAKVRQKLRLDTKELQQELRVPTILVTHDQREALELGDRVAVMTDGHIEQAGTPQEVYNSPKTERVAQFIGRANMFTTSLEGAFKTTAGKFPIKVMVRPEDMRVIIPQAGQDEPLAGFSGVVSNYVFLGRTVRLEVKLRDNRYYQVALPKREAMAMNLAIGERVYLEIADCRAFVGGHSDG